MDPLNGHGITDAFCDAELLAEAIDDGFSDRKPLQEALEAYETARNERKDGYYEANWKGARFEGLDKPELLRLRAALRDDPEQADRWAGTIAFSVHRDDFYSSSFVEEAMATAK